MSNHTERATIPLLEDAVSDALFRSEVAAWSRRIGVFPREIRLRPMKRKWASCSTNGRLTFDVALLRAEPRHRAEVIVHELLHLKVPNHGKLFRRLANSYLALPTEKTLAAPTNPNRGRN